MFSKSKKMSNFLDTRKWFFEPPLLDWERAAPLRTFFWYFIFKVSMINFDSKFYNLDVSLVEKRDVFRINLDFFKDLIF